MSTAEIVAVKIKTPKWTPWSEGDQTCPVCGSGSIIEAECSVDDGLAGGQKLVCNDCGHEGPVVLC